MINKLDAAQEAMVKIVRDEWINSALGGETAVDETALSEWLKYIYAGIGRGAPPYRIVGGPAQAQAIAGKMNGEENKNYPCGIGLGFDSAWSAFYDYFVRIGVINNRGFSEWIKYKKAGVWDCVLFENIAIIVRRPKLVRSDSRGRLHCENGPSVEFENGEKFFRWHGTAVGEKLILSPELVNKSDIASEKNSEVSRAMGEKIGWEKYLGLSEAELVDEHIDSNTGLRYSLYALGGDAGGSFAKLLKMESPRLNDGTKPYYVEPMPPGLNSAAAARRWKCEIDFYGDRPTVEDCNKNPRLAFSVEA